MITPSMAHSMARALHRGQVDKAGRPYIEHLERVANMLSNMDDETRVAAYLHDSVEDGKVDVAGLLQAGVTQRSVQLILAVTKMSDANYLDYVRGIARNRDTSALYIKLADLVDNMDAGRLALLDPFKASVLHNKYRVAKQIILDELIARDPILRAVGDGSVSCR